ncbi:MAG: helix-turn-helix domain-containing protein [Pseudomonadota bacterium]
MTTYKSALAICGLSQQEAAIFLGVSLASVKDWCRGRSTPPVGVWNMLAGLYARIEDAADHASSQLEPSLMDRRVMNNVAADSGADPLPGAGDMVAGAMALLLAIQDSPE